MPWTADVPISADLLGKCRGCHATIGWIRWTDAQGAEHPHPVDPKGWYGEKVSEATPGAKKGYTADGDRVACREFEAGLLFQPKGVTVFTSHFNTCPEAERFRARKVAPRA